MVFIIIALAFSLFFLSPVKIYIKINKNYYTGQAELILNYLNLLKINLLIPEMIFQIKNFTPFLTIKFKFSPKSRKSKKVVLSHRRLDLIKLKNFLELLVHNLKRFNRSSHWLLKRVKILKLELHLKFGRDNPEMVAITAGTLWVVIHLIMSRLSYMMDFSEAKINVKIIPYFIDSESLKLRLEGIFQIKLCHIIIASLFLPFIWISSKKSSIKSTEGAAHYG